MDSQFTDEQAKQLAAVVRAMPGWHGEAHIAMWPSQDEPGKYSGGWVVEVARDGDDMCYLLQSADEWPKLLQHLVAVEVPQPGYTSMHESHRGSWNEQGEAHALPETVAQREWHTTARVRITKACGAASVDPYRVRDFHVGEEIVMHQWGRAGRPVERDHWWTNFDIDGAFIIPAENVEVINVIDEVSPDAPE